MLYRQRVLDMPLVIDDEKCVLNHIRNVEIVGFESLYSYIAIAMAGASGLSSFNLG